VIEILMITVTIEKAGEDLTRLIDRAKAGEEIVITKGDEPVAKIVPVATKRKPRTPGRLKGQLDLPDSFFFDPLPEDELKLWSGEGDDRP
jgi:prevent-host-death family protein